jgi:hypothetical protein
MLHVSRSPLHRSGIVGTGRRAVEEYAFRAPDSASKGVMPGRVKPDPIAPGNIDDLDKVVTVDTGVPAASTTWTGIKTLYH